METIDLPPSGWLKLDPLFLNVCEADGLFIEFMSSLAWGQQSIMMFGRRVLQPRLTTFYGCPDVRYRYSGLEFLAHPWSGALQSLAERVSSIAGVAFNSVLCNLYRDGSDSMGWHADDESSLGENPVIGSVSLGARRRFDLKPKAGVAGLKTSLWLEHGSLLLMGGDAQHHWLHQIAKTKQVMEPRINLTFRQILS